MRRVLCVTAWRGQADWARPALLASCRARVCSAVGFAGLPLRECWGVYKQYMIHLLGHLMLRRKSCASSLKKEETVLPSTHITNTHTHTHHDIHPRREADSSFLSFHRQHTQYRNTASNRGHQKAQALEEIPAPLIACSKSSFIGLGRRLGSSFLSVCLSVSIGCLFHPRVCGDKKLWCLLRQHASTDTTTMPPRSDNAIGASDGRDSPSILRQSGNKNHVNLNELRKQIPKE